MSMPKYEPTYTVDQYLEIDRASDERYVYLDGEIFLMAGESPAHGDISVNIVVSLGGQLIDSPCRLRSKDTKVRSGETPLLGHSTKGMFSYPDVVVICAEPEYHDAIRDVILNPTAIVEVLSPGTEAFDRGEKFERLWKYNPSLTDYVLVSQDRAHLEHFTRQADGGWSLHYYDGLKAVVTIPSIRCTLSLAEVYRRIVFTPPSFPHT
jgi:Uma2 family endonuclease